jgi:hypothetical protein
MKVAVPFKDPGRAPGLTLGMSVSGVSVQALAQRSIYIHANHMRRTAQVVLRGYFTVVGMSEALAEALKSSISHRKRTKRFAFLSGPVPSAWVLEWLLHWVTSSETH